MNEPAPDDLKRIHPGKIRWVRRTMSVVVCGLVVWLYGWSANLASEWDHRTPEGLY